VGLRVNGYANIRAVRRVSPLPIIGIAKVGDRSGVYITPTMRQATQSCVPERTSWHSTRPIGRARRGRQSRT